MATPKKTENTQSVAPVKEESAAQQAAESKQGDKELDPRLVAVTFTLDRGDEVEEVEIEMFRDPMDAGDEVMEFAEQDKYVSYIRGLITPKSKMTMKSKGVTGRELLERVLPAYQEATQQGEG